jgi:hypothetical protein
MAKSQLKCSMKNLLAFLPNMVMLSGKLMIDSRVPRGTGRFACHYLTIIPQISFPTCSLTG